MESSLVTQSFRGQGQLPEGIHVPGIQIGGFLLGSEGTVFRIANGHG